LITKGVHYDGRITPEIKTGHPPSSYHVVLNEVFFGYLHKNNNQWHVSEQRPSGLVEMAGKQIEQSGDEFHVAK
jgi:hypothetical protein